MNFDAIAEKFNLFDYNVKKLIEMTISSVIAEAFGFDVEAYFAGCNDTLEIYGYPVRNGIIQRIHIPVTEIDARLVRKIRWRIGVVLHSEEILTRQQKLLKYENQLVQGRVFKYDARGNVYVNVVLNDLFSEQSLIAKCKWRHQTPKERYQYDNEELYHFYVVRVKAIMYDDMPVLEFHLSRSSWSLVRLLMTKYLAEVDPFTSYDVEVPKRVAGKYSWVHSPERKMSNEAITRVSRELKERIVPTYGSPEKAAAEREAQADKVLASLRIFRDR